MRTSLKYWVAVMAVVGAMGQAYAKEASADVSADSETETTTEVVAQTSPDSEHNPSTMLWMGVLLMGCIALRRAKG